MTTVDPFSGNLEEVWTRLSSLWLSSKEVMSGEVGPKWEMPSQHRACLDFTRKFPDSKEFLLRKLADPSALIAAYAFKCLIRIADLRPEELPPEILSRNETITTLSHSHRKTLSLAEYFNGYFEGVGGRTQLLDGDQQAQEWQKNVLDPYLRSTQKPPT